MSSIAKSNKRSKKTKGLGAPSVLRSDHYEAFDVDSKVECIRAHIPLGLMHVQEVLETEGCTSAGARYARTTPALPGGRQGSNPGSVQLAGQRHPLRISQVRHQSGGEIPLHALEQLRGNAAVEARCAKVDHWVNSSQRHRWLAAALLDIEPRLRRVKGYRHLPKLRIALQRELKIMQTATSKVA